MCIVQRGYMVVVDRDDIVEHVHQLQCGYMVTAICVVVQQLFIGDVVIECWCDIMCSLQCRDVVGVDWGDIAWDVQRMQRRDVFRIRCKRMCDLQCEHLGICKLVVVHGLRGRVLHARCRIRQFNSLSFHLPLI